METFGQKLRQAVASRGLRLDQLVKETGLPIEHIQALGCDDFGALPDDDVVENGLRAFAQLVGVEPGQVIEDYRSERRRWLDSLPAAEAEPAEPVEEIAPAPPRRPAGIAIWAPAILALALVAFFLFRPSASGSERSSAPVQEKAPMMEAAIPSVKPSVPARPAPPVDPPFSAGLSIPSHGVGRDVVDHELVGETRRFTEGERVWFWNRIEGGTAGESIHHVWIHEGEEELRVPLKLGAPRWRTQSYKTLSPGSAGSWTVEARDEAGLLLARQDFVCTPGR